MRTIHSRCDLFFLWVGLKLWLVTCLLRGPGRVLGRVARVVLYWSRFRKKKLWHILLLCFCWQRMLRYVRTKYASCGVLTASHSTKGRLFRMILVSLLHNFVIDLIHHQHCLSPWEPYIPRDILCTVFLSVHGHTHIMYCLQLLSHEVVVLLTANNFIVYFTNAHTPHTTCTQIVCNFHLVPCWFFSVKLAPTVTSSTRLAW